MYDTYQSTPDQKLTPHQRAMIYVLCLRSNMTQKQIGLLYGVSHQTVSKIWNGSWQTTRLARVVGVTK